jgi:hypothetical protein
LKEGVSQSRRAFLIVVKSAVYRQRLSFAEQSFDSSERIFISMP